MTKLSALGIALVTLCLITTHANAQPEPQFYPQECSEECSTPWVQTNRLLWLQCNGCPMIISAEVWTRIGCHGDFEIVVSSITSLNAFCYNCTVEEILALIFKDMVNNPPSNAPIPIGDQCVNYWRFKTSNCWAERYPIDQQSEYVACNGECCWSRFRICKINGIPTVITKEPGSNENINLPLCEKPRFQSDLVVNCHSICSQLWDHLPDGNPGAGSKIAVGSSVTSRLDITIAPNPTTKHVTLSWSAESEGVYHLIFFDQHGQAIKSVDQNVTSLGPVAIELATEGLPNGAVYYSLSVGDTPIGRGRFTIMR